MYKSTRRRRYEDLAWKGSFKDYKLNKLFGRKGRYLLVSRHGVTTVLPVEALTHKELISFVPRAHMRMPRHLYTQSRRSR